jgi:hydroxylamine dehydrogenase
MKQGVLTVLVVLLFWGVAGGANPPMSEETEACLRCHRSVTPGIVADWERSRMARVTPAAARSMISKKRRVSYDCIPNTIERIVVGCAECHSISIGIHDDTFDHNGFPVHVVVTPDDCAVCHPVEAEQYGKNIMSHAYGNLQNNGVYRALVDETNAVQTFQHGKTIPGRPNEQTDADACLYCHGTVVQVQGATTRPTAFGDMSFPVLSGWPNQGVGRINPDGSKGSCAACHTRHQFAIQMARKPSTCSECHKGPDVPAYKVYEVSKHGNVYGGLRDEWNFKAVPWTVGKDFSAPTCAACHVSLLVSPDGEVISERTHQMNDRLSWRIFGLIYAHPHPKSPDTTIIKNRAGLPLPTELTGEPASEYLIDAAEQEARRANMKGVCLSCHGANWVDGQFARLENTIHTTNDMTLTATKILLAAWDQGAARGLAQKDSIFNEALEKKWVEQWLFFANSTRFASAMMGADYGSFDNGRWYLSKNIQEMMDLLELKRKR